MTCGGAPTLMTLSFHRQSDSDADRIHPENYSHAECEECKNGAKLKEISQDFNMLFRQSCKGHHKHPHNVLQLKNVTVSLGCMCVQR